MNIKSVSWIMGAVALTACSGVPGIFGGERDGGLDRYFATSTGQAAGYAKALAESCPSLSFNAAELDLHRVAICRGGDLADDCAVPDLVTATQKSYADTLAELSGVSPDQVCAKAKTEAAADPVLAAYFN